MDKNQLIRYIFQSLNYGIIIAGIICFVLGNINFVNDSKTSYKIYINGSFIGGQLASLSISILIYGALGLYAIHKNDRIMVIMYVSITVVSLITRVMVWVLSAIHGIKLLESFNYAYVALELAIIIVSAFFYQTIIK